MGGREARVADLRGKVAVVTGASRGVGKGVALGLGEAGAIVYITGRSVEDGRSPEGLPGTIYRTAEEVTRLGGAGVPIPCDHRDDEQVEGLFRRVQNEQGRLDVLVNNVWGGYESMVEDGEFTFGHPFWRQPLWRWDAMFDAGVRAHFTSSRLASVMMVEQRRGLIVTISFWAARKYSGNVIYGTAKAADDRMIADMAHELREYNVAALSLYPGLVRTELVMRHSDVFDMSNSESPQFIGRAVAALAADPNVMAKSGQVLVAAAVAQEYGFTDVDGTRPRPLTLETA
jgi:NAD(P)-dependent dehydrogenase (short-subunit alcohol dehydrogenase family)